VVRTAVDEIVAIGVNCSAPGDVLDATRAARAAAGKPVVVYPNSGEEWDGARRVWTGRAGFSPVLAQSWVAAGARIIGGCCRIRPADIAAIATAVS